MRRLPRLLVAAGVIVASVVGVAAGSAGAPVAMRYVYHPPESALDHRYEYHWEILRTALERTREAWGPYAMEPSERMTEKRQAFEMRHATGRLTVMYLGTTPELERDLIPVRIPVDKNLGGYCVFLIRKEAQATFDAIGTLDDLRGLSYGIGLGWVDVEILRHNGFRVVTGSDYDGLFRMLANGRFDAFPRAAVEVLDEHARRATRMPDLAIERSLILYYPLPMYFWFPKTDEGRRLADRARQGMTEMIEDGTYDRIFVAYHGEKVERLDLRHRRVFRVANPMLGPETPFDDKRLWFDPTKDDLPASRPAR